MKFASLAPSTKIVSGDSKCPRTVTIQILDPNPIGGNVNKLFVHSDKQILDAAVPVVVGTPSAAMELNDGVDVQDPFGDTVRITIPGVTSDLYIRALTLTPGNPPVAVLNFPVNVAVVIN